MMRVFVAGGSGAVGRRLVPQLVALGHQVTATTTDPAKVPLLEDLGATAVIMDGLDAAQVGEAVTAAEPDAVVHQMTSIGAIDMKHLDRAFAQTNRLRTEGLDHLLGAVRASGVPHVVTHSYGAWNGIREGGWVKTESEELDPMAGMAAEPVMPAVVRLERLVVEAGGAALRYAGSTGRARPRSSPSRCASGSSRWSAAAPATPPECATTTPRAPRCWRLSSARGACSTSSTTSQPPCMTGCRTSRRSPPRACPPGSRARSRAAPGCW